MNSFEEMLQKQSDLEKERDLLLARVASLQADKDIRSFMVVCHERDCARGMLSLTRDKLIACEDALEAARALACEMSNKWDKAREELAECQKAYYSVAQPEHYRIAIDKLRVERDAVTKLTKERDEARKELACWNTVKALTPIPPRAITWENGVEILNAVQEAMKGSIK